MHVGFGLCVCFLFLEGGGGEWQVFLCQVVTSIEGFDTQFICSFGAFSLEHKIDHCSNIDNPSQV